MRKFATYAVQVLLVTSAFSLTGCADWERHAQSKLPPPLPAYQAKQIQVVPTRSVHAVSFTDGALKLSSDEQGMLASFLDTTHRDASAVVLVEQPPRSADRLSRQRAAALAEGLSKGGLTVKSFTPEQPSASGTLQVAVDHLMAIAPNCPDWDIHPYFAYGSSPLPNQGCSDRTNLAAMVANPRDLVAGAVPSAPTGHGALRGEVEYRSDTLPALQDAGEAQTQ